MLAMKDILKFEVPAGSMAVWWLGQAGFLLKSPQGVTAVIDPYLSDACGAIGEKMGIDCHRIFPPPMAPEELVGVDLYVLTHSHEDHLDSETINPYRKAGGRGPFLAPLETADKLRDLTVPEDQIVTIWPNKIHNVADLSFRATLAVPYGGDDLTHVGYLVSLNEGPTFYFTGDTAYHEVIGISVAEHKPNVMFAVINGTWRNLSPAEAACLAHQIQPEVVIPYHYDLFPDGRMVPHALRVNLMLYGMQDSFRSLDRETAYVFPQNRLYPDEVDHDKA